MKFTFIERPSSEQLVAFAKMWSKMLIHHPGTFISAFLSNTYGYFDLTKNNFWDGTNGVYTIGESYEWNNSLSYNFYHLPEFEQLRILIEGFHNKLCTIFPFSVFYCCGLYTYILIFCFIKLIREKNLRKVYILVPGLISLLFCMISPVNAMIRYALPIFEMAPLLIAYSGRTVSDTESE